MLGFVGLCFSLLSGLIKSVNVERNSGINRKVKKV